MKKYDYSLDAIKGFSCILMIIAHTSIEFSGGKIIYQTLAGIAPVLFFAVSGITTTFQSERKNFISIFLFYFLFAILGLSYNAMWRPYLWSNLTSDVPQIIAIGVLSIFLIEKYLKPHITFYLISPVFAFIFHYLAKYKIPDFPLKMFVFNEGSFSFFPWIFTFLAGIFAYRIRNNMNLFFAVGSALILLMVYLKNPHDDYFIKWDMSIGYFLLSLTILFLTFYLFRRKQEYDSRNLFIFFGKNSLLFLYIHLYLANEFYWLGILEKNIVLIWLLNGVMSYFLIKILIYLNSFIEKCFESKILWSILIILTVIIPVTLTSTKSIFLLETSIGIFFAMNYKYLSKITNIRLNQNKKQLLKSA